MTSAATAVTIPPEAERTTKSSSRWPKKSRARSEVIAFFDAIDPPPPPFPPPLPPPPPPFLDSLLCCCGGAGTPEDAACSEIGRCCTVC
jgi:hypothetical protein